MEVRRSEGLPCKKVSLYSDGHSGLEMAIMQANFPTSARAWLAQQVNLTPCFIFNRYAVEVVVDIDYVAEDPCDEDPDSKECKFNSKPFKARYEELEDKLPDKVSRYHFKAAYNRAKRSNKDWKDTWKEDMLSAFCEVAPRDLECEPSTFKRLNDFIKLLQENGVWSLYG